MASSLPLVACAQMDIAWEDRAANLTTAARLLQHARLPRGTLFVLPEMFAAGFSMSAEVVSEPVDGPTATFLSQLAREHGVFVLAGVPVRGDDGKCRNEALAFDDHGALVGRYAKMHPFTLAGEPKHYAAGTSITQFVWQGVRVTPHICYDLRFPELFRCGARLGTDLFVNIASWPKPRVAHMSALALARAIENQAYFVACNRTGTDPACTYNGQSAIFDHTGAELAHAGEAEGVITAAVDLEGLRAWRAKLPFLQDMRADLVPALPQ